MGWSTPNPYYNPEHFGLRSVTELDWSQPCYSFDKTVVWADADEKLYWASDSGCSCPSPFEDIDILDELETGTKHDLFAELDQRLSETTYEREWAEREVAQTKETILLGGYR